MKAITAVDIVFNHMPEKKSMCAHYVYQMAKTFVTESTPNPNDTGHGNCGSEEYYNSLKNLGYKEVLNKTVSKNYIIDDVKNGQFPEGTVVAYKAIDKLNESDNIPNAFKYGHTQFFTNIPNNKWATSVRDNYGCDFVYNKINSDNWNYRVFIPPKENG